MYILSVLKRVGNLFTYYTFRNIYGTYLRSWYINWLVFLVLLLNSMIYS